jgi:hypothetical protein
LQRGEKASVGAVFQIRVRPIAAPAHPQQLSIPAPPPRELKLFLSDSPLIDPRAGAIRRLADETTAPHTSAWDQVKSLHAWIVANIAPLKGETVGAVDALKAGKANNEDRVNLFVALCRAHKVPARIVWVDGGEYAEFHLVDAAGNGHWFPAQFDAAGEFGCNSRPRVIEQKGENIKVPEKDQRQRYVNEYASGKSKGPMPTIEFVRQGTPIK